MHWPRVEVKNRDILFGFRPATLQTVKMFKSLKKKPEKVKEKADFKFTFHATRVCLSLSLLSLLVADHSILFFKPLL